ncbi:hypothetical protein [Pantoea ananatis]|uniref:hypothetical protein n=1 Tax=Pantoea ananas TaxID=553 RepID=UPI001B30F634|nr:hypothetical protein [Pantoea ananatis]
MMKNAMFFVPTFSEAAGVNVVNVTDYMTHGAQRITCTDFTSVDTFVNFPMDEIHTSMMSGNVVIPSQLSTIDEIDAWLMEM